MNYKFVHSCIRVLDLEKSIDFYKNALNLKIARERDFPEYEFTLIYMKSPESDFEIELTYNYDQEEPNTIGNGYSHIAATVEDIKTAHKKHAELGYEVSELKSLDQEAEGGYYFLSDPDGYRIEVIQE